MTRSPLPFALTRLTAALAFAVLLGSGMSGGLAGAETTIRLTTDQIAQDPAAAHRALGLGPSQAVPVPLLPEFAPFAEPLQADLSDLRGVLTQLAILAGANDHLFLLQAQAGAGVTAPPQALVVVKGATDLASLAAQHPGLVVPDGPDGWQLTGPLVIWQGARLQLGAGQRLTLSTADGAFLLVFGQLEVTGATLTATDAPNLNAEGFRPFLLAAGGAEMRLTGATIRGLGMANRGLFAGVTHVSSGLFPPATPPVISASRFDETGRLSLRHAKGAVIADNQFTGGGGIDIVGGSGLLLTGNLLQRTTSSFALRLSGGVQDTVVQATTILQAESAGLAIAGLSRRIVLADTLIDESTGDGVSVDRATCLRIAGLAVLRGQSVGLRLRASGHVSVTGGAILDNRTSGITVEAQPDGAPLALIDLRLAGNASGIKGWGTTQLDLLRVDLTDQTPRLLAGDLAPFTGRYLQQTQQLDQPDFSIRLTGTEPDSTLIPAALQGDTPTFLPQGATPWDQTCAGG
jgi:poly(beta-D-mannuronate) C5 epimerase